ncbi:MAG: response regulator [Opitutaceae bacterium]|nr:response regulator [Opitutaceae bacterium]
MAKQQKVPKHELALQAQLGASIRTFRRQLGLTQEELAWRADMHRTYIADIERGARNITLRSAANLASALQLTVDALLAHSRQPAGAPAPAGALAEVLLIEDDSADEEMTLRAFRRARLSNPVRVLRDGAEALDYLFQVGRDGRRPIPPQLVLLDLQLPKVPGLEVLRQLKADPGTRDLPVVILTASQREADFAECSRLGAELYLVKPVAFEGFARITPQLNFSWALLRPVAEPKSA